MKLNLSVNKNILSFSAANNFTFNADECGIVFFDTIEYYRTTYSKIIYIEPGVWEYNKCLNSMSSLSKEDPKNVTIRIVQLGSDCKTISYARFSDLRIDPEPWFKEGNLVTIRNKRSILSQNVKTFYLYRDIYHLASYYDIENKQVHQNIILSDKKEIDLIEGVNYDS